MLSLAPDDLANEVNRAEEFRRRHTIKSREIMRRYIGNWFRDDVEQSATPENSIFSFIAFMMPNVWYSDPSAQVTAKRPKTHGEIAEWMEAGIRSVIAESSMTDQGQQAVRDAFAGFGVLQVGIEPRDFPGDRMQQRTPGQDAGAAQSTALRPFVVRVPPERIIIDPRATDQTNARFIGHSYQKDLDQLRAEAQRGDWDADNVARLSAGANDPQFAEAEKALGPANTPDRKRVELVDLWIAEHNVLITLARQNSATNMILRQCTYYGPREGPYEIYGFYSVPNDPYPMSPLQPAMESFEELWAHQRTASEDATNFKRFVAVESRNKTLFDAISKAKTGSVIMVEGLGDYKEISMGGTPEGRQEHIEQLRDRTDRTTGMSDAQRGILQGDTATENEIVKGSVDTRTSFLRQRTVAHTARVLKRVGWYLFYDPNVAMPVTFTDRFTGAVTEKLFIGGSEYPGQEDVDWVDFNLTIEPTSMPFADANTLAQRAMSDMQLAEQVAQGMRQFPEINYRLIVNDYGTASSRQDLFDVLFNQSITQQFGQTPQAFGYAAPGTVPLPGSVNPSLVGAGFGFAGGPPPQWGAAPAPGPNDLSRGGGMGGPPAGMMMRRPMGGGPPSQGMPAPAGRMNFPGVARAMAQQMPPQGAPIRGRPGGNRPAASGGAAPPMTFPGLARHQPAPAARAGGKRPVLPGNARSQPQHTHAAATAQRPQFAGNVRKKKKQVAAAALTKSTTARPAMPGNVRSAGKKASGRNPWAGGI